VPAEPGAVPSATALDAWVARVSDKTDIPARVLRAYANAETVIRAKTPGCHLTWATVAGIGRIESLNGGHGGSEIDANGNEVPPVIGITLDGSDGVLAVHDTDAGQFDGDPTWDHAIGPMQFLPATWHRWGVRANGDGKAPDAQNIDDAALTTARYMCAKGGDLATPDGWWTAVLTYNNSTEYGQEVFSNASAYGTANLTP
jgi:membrane-bound lytic murein transglycosylase B